MACQPLTLTTLKLAPHLTLKLAPVLVLNLAAVLALPIDSNRWVNSWFNRSIISSSLPVGYCSVPDLGVSRYRVHYEVHCLLQCLHVEVSLW